MTENSHVQPTSNDSMSFYCVPAMLYYCALYKVRNYPALTGTPRTAGAPARRRTPAS